MASTLQTMRSGGTQHPEQVVNATMTDLVTGSGILSPSSNHFYVEQSDTPAMTVDIRQGYAHIRKSDGTMVYPVRLYDTDATVAVTSNSSGNSRIDAVILYIDLGASANATVTNVATLAVVAGTPAASPSAPSDSDISTAIGASNPFLRLANVTVASGATTIVNANIVDKRVATQFLPHAQITDSLSRQSLINGNFDVWQRNTTFTTPNDDTYGPDRWNFLTDTNSSWTFSRSTTVPSTKSTYSLKAVNVTANRQCGIVQLIENIEATKLIGQYASLSFQAKTSGGLVISNLRATVLAWTSTADSMTSDVVATWAGAGTDPTFAANYTKEIAGFNLALTTSWQTFKVENIYLDTASTNNLAVVIWVDDTTITATDEFYITQIQLNVGDVALPFQAKSFDEELAKCQRFYQKSFEIAVTPATNTGSFLGAAIANSLGASTNSRMHVQHKVTMRGAPAVTTFNPSAANSQARDASAAADCSSTAADVQSQYGFQLTSVTPGGSVAGNAIACHWTADSEL